MRYGMRLSLQALGRLTPLAWTRTIPPCAQFEKSSRVDDLLAVNLHGRSIFA